MITSLTRSIRRALPGDGPASQASARAETGYTRATLLRMMTGGLVTAGTAMASARASAARAPRIAPVVDLDRLYDAWQQRFNDADIDAMVDLYVPHVSYINPEGKLLIGKPGVRADFESLFALKPRIDIHDRKHIVYRDISLTTNHWTLRLGKPVDGKYELAGGGIEVVQKQPDGGWRYIIDDASRSAS